jgi:hypothetical protein
MIDPEKFEQLATAAKEAEEVRVQFETKHAEARKQLEDAARVAAQARDAVRLYVEQESGIRLR